MVFGPTRGFGVLDRLVSLAISGLLYGDSVTRVTKPLYYYVSETRQPIHGDLRLVRLITLAEVPVPWVCQTLRKQ